MVRPIITCAATFLVCAVGALQVPSAHAEPIQIGGSIQPSTAGTPNYQWSTLFLDGQFFTAEIPRPLTPGEQLCTPCLPGQLIDLGTTVSLAATGLWHSPDGVGREAHGEGELRFQATPIVVPTDPHGALLFSVEFPLMATGFLRFIDGKTSEVLFDNSVVGSGIGLLTLTGTADATPYAFRFVNYRLADPVPEPASMLLTGTALLWLARRVRSSHRRRTTQLPRRRQE